MPKSHLFLLLLFSLLKNWAQSPSFAWVDLFTGSHRSFVQDHCVDAFGNIYFVGNFADKIDLDPSAGNYTVQAVGSNVEPWDFFVAKVNAQGSLLWAKVIHADGSSYNISNEHRISIDLNNDIYISGIFKSTTDFDPGPFTYTIDPQGDAAFLLKLNSSGNFSWVKHIRNNYPKNNWSSNISCVATCSNAVYWSGIFVDTVDVDPGPLTQTVCSPGDQSSYILQLDFNGSLNWVRHYESSGSVDILALASDNNNNVFATGALLQTGDLDPGTGTFTLASNGVEDGFLTMLDNNGNFAWACSWGGPQWDHGESVTTDNTAVYLTGTFQGTVDLDPGTSVYTASTSSNYAGYVLKFNKQGQLIMPYVFNPLGSGSFGATEIAVKQGDMYVCGYFMYGADFNPGPATHTLACGSSSDIFLMKLSANGQLAWVHALYNSSGQANAIAIGPNDEIISSGYFGISTDFDPGLANYQQAPDWEDGFLLKWNQNGILQSVVESRQSIGATLFPNPGKDKIHIGWENEFKYKVIGLTGQVLFSGTSPSPELDLCLDGLKSGLYLITLENGSQTLVVKFLKEQ